MSAILIPYALKDEKLVHVDSVERGANCQCICPNCRKPVQAKQGEIRIHHFSHIGKISCSPVEALKKVAILLLYDKLMQSLAQGIDVKFEWDCLFCHKIHAGNILQKATKIGIVDDPLCNIALSGNDNKLIAGIKITSTKQKGYSREDKKSPLQEGILIELNIKTEADLKKISSSIIKFDKVLYCREEKSHICPLCGNATYKKYLAIIETECWRCHNHMKVVALQSLGRNYSLDVFSANDINIASYNRVIIRQRYSKTVGGKYLACCCAYCNSFSGNHYFHDYDEKFNNAQKITTKGFFCVECEKSFDS